MTRSSASETVSPCTRRVRLLVSVASADEAVAACSAGVEILDIKNPERGSLGMADLSVIQEIVAQQATRNSRGEVPISAALGEVSDWIEGSSVPELPLDLMFAKLGLSSLAKCTHWAERWCAIRQRFDAARGVPLNWVAVAYADAAAAQSPPLPDIVEAAITADCSGVLIDTWSKTSGWLLDSITIGQIRQTADRCRRSGLFLALAGKLSVTHLHELNQAGADILAIRSAACREGDRRLRVDAERILQFRAAMTSAGFDTAPRAEAVRQ